MAMGSLDEALAGFRARAARANVLLFRLQRSSKGENPPCAGGHLGKWRRPFSSATPRTAGIFRPHPRLSEALYLVGLRREAGGPPRRKRCQSFEDDGPSPLWGMIRINTRSQGHLAFPGRSAMADRRGCRGRAR